MFAKAALLLSIVAALAAADAQITKMWGVQKSMESHFASAVASGTFSCMDGSKSGIPIEYVNDQYCDCADGSDEPGTSACSYDVKFPKDWRFQCQTPIADHYKELFHSRINDGICDCCDGSDEYLGYAKCVNNCAEAAEREEREAREREARRQAGLQAKKELETKGEQIKADTERQLAEAKAELAKIEEEIAPLAIIKAQEEEKEKAEREEIKAKSLEEKEKWEAEQAAKKAAEDAADKERKDAVAAEPDVPRAADGESIRYVCSKWRQTKECKGDGERDSLNDVDCDVTVQGGWSGYCECFDSVKGVEVKHPFDCNHKILTCEYVCAHEGKEGDGKTNVPPGSGSEDSDEEKFKVDEGSNHFRAEANEARNKWQEVENRRQPIKDKISDLEKTKEAAVWDYPAFLALKGQCFDRDDGSYNYNVCLFDDARQRPRGQNIGGTVMGNFNSFGEQTYSVWGARHDLSKIKFDNGQHCYGGPARSVEVSVICGPETKLLSVDEPSMCTYKMVLSSPAICE